VLAVASGRFGIVIFGNRSLIKSRNSDDHKSVLILGVVLCYGSWYCLRYCWIGLWGNATLTHNVLVLIKPSTWRRSLSSLCRWAGYRRPSYWRSL